MSAAPWVSLAVALGAAAVAWRRRADFAERPWFHWFLYLHLAATRFTYVPGVLTGTALYLPLALLATRTAVARDAVGARGLVLALAVGTLASTAPFLHVHAWLALR